METLKLYVVRNKEGKYFRRKGYGGYGDTWVEGMATARIYAKIGPARSMCTFFARAYPKFGIPEIVELSVSETRVLDQSSRVSSALSKREEKEARQKLEYKEWQKQQLEKEISEATKKLKNLQKR